MLRFCFINVYNIFFCCLSCFFVAASYFIIVGVVAPSGLRGQQQDTQRTDKLEGEMEREMKRGLKKKKNERRREM